VLTRYGYGELTRDTIFDGIDLQLNFYRILSEHTDWSLADLLEFAEELANDVQGANTDGWVF
jgi:hypothetical protein